MVPIWNSFLYIPSTVKPGNKEQFDKEQIGIKTISCDQFAIYFI